jgi:hypothetical protein
MFVSAAMTRGAIGENDDGRHDPLPLSGDYVTLNDGICHRPVTTNVYFCNSCGGDSVPSGLTSGTIDAQETALRVFSSSSRILEGKHEEMNI